MIQPFFIKDGKNIVYKGTRSKCITKLITISGKNPKIVKNPRYKWIEIEDE